MSDENKQKPTFYFANANVLLGIARRAYGQTVLKDASTVMDNSITAILLSCAALEGYINETSALLNEMPDMTEGKPKAKAFADILSEAEANRASIRLKYLLALPILTGETFDKGANPYQDFDLLFAIRDEIMHYKLEKVTNEPHRIVKRMRTKGLTKETPGSPSTWLVKIATAEAARWACNTAAIMINSVQRALFANAENDDPASMFRLMSSITFGILPEFSKSQPATTSE